jgi:hypothetical protein
LSQGSSAQGMRSIVTRMSRMVMSGLVIGVSSARVSWPDHVRLIQGQRKSTTEGRR